MQNEQILNALANLINTATSKNQLLFDTAFNIFIDYSKSRCRIDTIEYYSKKYILLKKVLNQLGIEHTGQITKVSYSKIINILSSMNYKNSTINKVCDLLKSIFKVCNELEYINYNPISGIKKLKEIIPKIEIVKKENKTNIENYLLSLEDTNINCRNIVFFLLMNDTGARLNELINIKISNINIEENYIYLEFTKTSKARYVYFRNLTKSYLIKLINYIDNNEYLFINFKTNEQLKKHTAYDIIDIIQKKLNIKGSISPHKWRHSIATELVNENVHVNENMSVLGHTQFSTTQRYIHQTNTKIKNDILNVLEK